MLGTQEPFICGSAIPWGLTTRLKERKEEEEHTQEVCLRVLHVACGTSAHTSLGGTQARGHTQPLSEKWTGVGKQILLGTIVTEKRDLGIELGSTPSIAGQEGFYSQGAGWGQWVENS